MTADGTYPVTRAGETVTAKVSSFYGGLPDPDEAEVAFVVPRDVARRFTLGSTIAITLDPSPDAPQPATGDAVARAALAAARAGEAEPVGHRWPVNRQRPAGDDYYACECGAYLAEWLGDAEKAHVAHVAAQRGGEAVDREALAKVIREAIDAAYTFEGDLDPDVDQAVTNAVLDLLAARGDAAPTEVEWGVRVRGAEDVSVTHDQGEAERIASDVGYVEVVSRDVHRSAWQVRD